MFAYLYMAIGMCRLTGTAPSFLLHPLDVIGGDQAPQLSFFPGMELSSEAKTDLLLEVLQVLQRHFDLRPMSEHAHLCKAASSVPVGLPGQSLSGGH